MEALTRTNAPSAPPCWVKYYVVDVQDHGDFARLSLRLTSRVWGIGSEGDHMVITVKSFAGNYRKCIMCNEGSL